MRTRSIRRDTSVAEINGASSFFASLKSSLALFRGTGSPTYTRATTAYVTDFEGLSKTAKSGEARFTGARRVENLIATSSENATTAGSWLAFNGTPVVTLDTGDFPVGTTKSTQIASSQLYSGVRQNAVVLIGRTYTVRWFAKAIVAGKSMVLSNIVDTDIATVVLTTNWVAYSATFTATQTDLGWLVKEAAAATIKISGIVVSDVTGQTNQNPSEYVSVGVLSSPYHGAGVDGVKYFEYQNGNTVASNVVTEAQGAPIANATLKGYLAEVAATNICLQSNAFTTTWLFAGTGSRTQNAVGITGTANEAWTITDTDAASSTQLYQAITLTATAYTFSLFVKKTTGAQASYPVVFVNAGTTIAIATIDTSNGTATAWTAYTGNTMLAGISARCTAFNTNYWRVELTYTATAAAYTHWLVPAGTTNATQSTGTLDATAQGSVVIQGAQVELGSFATSYIPTTTVSVTRNADVLTYPNAGNISSTLGSVYVECFLPSSSDNHRVLVGSNVIDRSCINVTSLSTGNQIRHYDGVNWLGAQVANVNGAINKLSMSYSGTAADHVNNGTIETSTAFDGSFDFPDLSIGVGTTGFYPLNGNIRNVRIWQTQLPDATLQVITG